jgi:hypothetical protein
MVISEFLVTLMPKVYNGAYSLDDLSIFVWKLMTYDSFRQNLCMLTS